MANPRRGPHATPDQLMTMLADIANGIDDHGGLSVEDVVMDIIADIQSSYKLAMEDMGVRPLQVADVHKTVTDYIVNHYGNED